MTEGLLRSDRRRQRRPRGTIDSPRPYGRSTRLDVAIVLIAPDLDQPTVVEFMPHRDFSFPIGEVCMAPLYLHHVGQDQDDFIRVFGENVIPRLS